MARESVAPPLAVPVGKRAWAPLTGFLRALLRKPLGFVAGLLVLALIIIAIFAPQIAPYDPMAMKLMEANQSPTLRHLAGTDDMGRDVLSRLIFGSRISLMVGFITVSLGTVSGAVLGMISGFFEGKVDMVIQRIADAVMAFPGLVFLLVIVSILGPGIGTAMLAIAMIIWPGESRIIRGATLSIKNNVYVEAARAVGAGNFYIVRRHILPNVAAPIIITASVMLGSAILLETSLSFLGLGATPPTPSWGLMLSTEGRARMEQAPWLAVAPGVAISLAVLGLNLFGDALRDILDPRLRGSR